MLSDPYVSTSSVDAWEAAYEQALSDEAQQQADSDARHAAESVRCACCGNHPLVEDHEPGCRNDSLPDVLAEQLAADPDCVDFSAELATERAVSDRLAAVVLQNLTEAKSPDLQGSGRIPHTDSVGSSAISEVLS